MTDMLALSPQVGPDLIGTLNPQQREAVLAPIDGALQVMAGAGTGKTELITRRFAKLTGDLLSQSDPTAPDPTSRIWVSTFTEKAAAEMKHRIAAYVEQSYGMPLSPKAWIGTFHGLCHRMLKRHGQSRKAMGTFSIVSDVELSLLQEQLINRLLAGADDSLAQALARAQVHHVSPDCLQPDRLLSLGLPDITRLFEEIVFQVIPRIKASGLSPEAFYRQAMDQSGALSRLIEALPVIEPQSGLILDEHIAYATAWERHLKPIRHEGHTFLPTDWQVEIAARKALRKGQNAPAEGTLLRDNLKPLYQFKCFVCFDGRKKKAPFSAATEDFTLLHQATALEQCLVEVVTAVYVLYQEMLRTEQVCDYDDLIHQTLHLLRDYPEVQAHYRQHFAHLMVDEFQDSNGSQLQLMQLLNPADSPRLTVVGDKKQSIYGFRFAEPENLSLLFAAWPQTQTIALQTNYRSQSPVLAMANRLTEMMQAGPDAVLLPFQERQHAEPASIQWLDLSDFDSVGQARWTEIQWIAETTAGLLASDTYTARDIAVLVRDNGKALQVENALEALGIPAIKQNNLGFFAQPVIQQAMALLELAHNPHDDFALVNLLQRRLSHRQLALLARHRKGLRQQFGLKDVSYLEALWDFRQQDLLRPAVFEPVWPAVTFLLDTVNTAQYKKQALTPDLLFPWLMQAFPLVSPAEAPTRAGRKALKQIALLQSMITHWVGRARKPMDLETVLTLLKRCQAKNNLDLPMDKDFSPDLQAVRIMTIHGAKGLEFPVVFLAGVESHRRTRDDGLMTFDPQYPGKLGLGLVLNRLNDEKTLKRVICDQVWKMPRTEAEELRLFYVAVTRARERLYLASWPRSFPYLDPGFFSDLRVDVLSADTVSWFSEAERNTTRLLMERQYPVTAPFSEPGTLSGVESGC